MIKEIRQFEQIMKDNAGWHLMKIILIFICFHWNSYSSASSQEDLLINSVSSIDVVSYPGSDSFESKGSGVIVNFKGNNYFITNAHVCVGSYIGLLTDKNKIELNLVLKQSMVRYDIRSLNNRYEMMISLSKIYLDFKKDICLIPIIAGKSEFYNLSEKIANKNDLVYRYTYRGGAVIKNQGQFIQEMDGFYSLNYNDAKNEKQEIANVGAIVEYGIKTNAGDSGSVVVNMQNEFVGIVVGATTKNNALVIKTQSIIQFLQSIVAF